MRARLVPKSIVLHLTLYLPKTAISIVKAEQALALTHHKLSTLKDGMKELKNVTDLTIRIESHILAVEAWEESRRKEEEKNERD